MIKNKHFRKYYIENKDKHIENVKKLNEARRYIIIKHYSNDTMKCNCCGESEYDFLTVDHKDNNGCNHKKIRGKKYNLYQEIYKTLPKGYQILCMNCNHSKGRHNGKCIHEL